jgi:acetolactate synthase-1/3 small subunit
MNTLHLELDGADGSLLRLIGLIERRGFFIDRIEMDRPDNRGARKIALGVRARDAHRCVEVLGRQIDRLYGVRRHADDPQIVEGAVCVP